MNNQREVTQPQLSNDALGLFAEASIALNSVVDETALRQHAERLACLTHSDLVLLYEARERTSELTLIAQWGLTPDVEPRFQVLGDEQTTGAGGLRAASEDPAPLSYEPLTQDLQDLGIRAYWGYPLWSNGALVGQLFFGSRQWDQFHKVTLAVFTATTLHVTRALERRKPTDVEPGQPSWSESGGQSAADKRQQFIAVLAHELRNPIAPIRSGLDLLATDLLDAESRRSTTAMMQRQVAHLVRLIDDLLDTVRLDKGKLQVKREQTLLKHVVRSAIESIRPALESKHQALRLSDEEAAVVVDVDPVRLSQAFVNILSANVKQTPEGGIIGVSVVRDAATLKILFEDENSNIDFDQLRNVFQLFPSSPLKSSTDGIGIGLALVKGLIELNDGTVDVHSRADQNGAVYTVALPVSPVDASTLSVYGDAPDPVWPSHRILVVDDNRDAADTLGLLFELDGHTIRLAHDGPSAVAEAREFQPEFILMDIGLPGFDGNEAVRRIRSAVGKVRPFIIALTGWGAPADRDATRAAGCDLHFVKPVVHHELRRALLKLTSEKKSE